MSEPTGEIENNVASKETSLMQLNGKQSAKQELCATCSGIGLRVSRFIVQPSAEPGSRYTPLTFRPASSTSSLKVGTIKELYEKGCKGCAFCTLLIRSAQQSLEGCSPDSNYWPQLLHVSCSIRWEVDGRQVLKAENPVEAKKKSRDNPRGLTRRIHVTWDDTRIRDCYLIFVAREKYLTTASDAHRIWGSESLFLGRKIQSGGNIQARVKSWLDLCREHHKGPCDCPSRKERSKFSKLMSHSYFGVIDVLNMQLTELPRHPVTLEHEPYVALSYVWGTKRTFVADLKNVNLLRMHGGLEKVLTKLPQVIKDTIDLVRRLGLQYLWIDALCIIQDSARSWKLNAYNMDSIYGNAELTICAADGDDAFSGLKAMQPDNFAKKQEMADCAPGVRLMISHPPEMYIRASKWNSRAWTFQERLLSRRCLIFIDGRVYFQCRSTGMSEDVYADREGAGWSLDFVDAPLQMFRQLSERSFWVYMKVAELYGSRELTKSKDILAAFSGITNSLERRMKSPFIFGLPTSHFDLSLLWQHSSAMQRRKPRNAEEVSEYGDLEFPSWSWIGWMGAAPSYDMNVLGDCLDNVSEWLENHTWIRWYVRDGHGDLRPLWTDQRSKDNYATQRGQGTKQYWRVDRSEDARWRGYSIRRTSGKLIPTHHSKRSKPGRIRGYVIRYNDDFRYGRRDNSADSFSSDDSPLSDWEEIAEHRGRSRSRSSEERRRLVQLEKLEREKLEREKMERKELEREKLEQEREGFRRRPRRSPDYYWTTRAVERTRSVSSASDRRNQGSRDELLFRSHFLLRFVGELVQILRMLLLALFLSLDRLRFYWLAGWVWWLREWITPSTNPSAIRRDDRRPRQQRHEKSSLLDFDHEYVTRNRSPSPPCSPPRLRSHGISQYRAHSPLQRNRRTHAVKYEWDPGYSYDRHNEENPFSEDIAKIRRNSLTQPGNSHHYRPHVERFQTYADKYDSPRHEHRTYERLQHNTREYDRHAYELSFMPTEDIGPADTERDPKFYIYPKECPYRIVIAPYSRNVNSVEFPLMPILQFWTWHSWLNITVPASEGQSGTTSTVGEGLKRCHICDESGDWCGSIVLDEQWVKSASSARQEFIAISEAKKFNQDECSAWTYYIPKERDQSEWDLFYVMLIERKGEKWERVGLGKMFKEAFMRKAKWKEIMLG